MMNNSIFELKENNFCSFGKKKHFNYSRSLKISVSSTGYHWNVESKEDVLVICSNFGRDHVMIQDSNFEEV